MAQICLAYRHTWARPLGLPTNNGRPRQPELLFSRRLWSARRSLVKVGQQEAQQMWPVCFC